MGDYFFFLGLFLNNNVLLVEELNTVIAVFKAPY